MARPNPLSPCVSRRQPSALRGDLWDERRLHEPLGDGARTPSPFHSTIFVLLEYAVLVRPAAEMVRRLENAVGDPEALVCMAVWLACPEGPPASLRESSPDLLPEIDPPSSTPAGPPPC